jgi:hypothetical protein
MKEVVDETVITCSVCGLNFDEADVNIIDYDLDLCGKCEEKHKKEMSEKNMANEKSVTLTLDSITFKVNGNSTEELVQNAKIALAEQLSSGKFPSVTYSIGDANALSIETAYAGLIVESNDGKIGICTAVNKKTIHVTYQNHISVAGSPTIFKASSAKFEEARSKRRDADKKLNWWSEGFTGYLKTGEGIIPVVVGKTKGGKTRLEVINEKSYYSVSEQLMNRDLKDELTELQLQK